MTAEGLSGRGRRPYCDKRHAKVKLFLSGLHGIWHINLGQEFY